MILMILLYFAAWESATKRKIGLTITSYLAIFLTPFVACIVSYCTRRIDKTTKHPTYEQRLPYENTTAMLISAIISFILGLLLNIVGLVGIGQSSTTYSSEYDRFIGMMIAYGIIYIVWGVSLIRERKKLLLAKETAQTNVCPINSTLTPVAFDNDSTLFSIIHEFDSKNQQRIAPDGSIEEDAQPRMVTVEFSKETNSYRVGIMNTENGQNIMNPVLLHEESFSKIDECMTLKSEDGEYSLNLFFKDGELEKCVISRKSKNVFIHYLK